MYPHVRQFETSARLAQELDFRRRRRANTRQSQPTAQTSASAVRTCVSPGAATASSR
jgi:hypothetical protein